MDMDIQTTLLASTIPVICVLVPCIALVLTCVHHRRPNDLEQFLPHDIKTRFAEAPGDTVTMYVELEVDEEAERRRREHAVELDGRGVGGNFT